jgi:hypothetical protein
VEQSRQYSFFFQTFQLPLGHAQPKSKGFGDPQGMAFSITLQKRQHPGGGAIAENRFENRVQEKTKIDPIAGSFDSAIGSYYPYMG